MRLEINTNIYKKWANLVKRRCWFRCVCCGKKSGICHHLDGWSWAYSLRYEPRNGVVLCKDHHNQFHLIYGKECNTRAQFDEFLRLYFNKKLDDIL